MQKYKDPNGQLHELESEEFTYLLPPGSEKISETEAAQLLAPSAEQLWAAVQLKAKAALDGSDIVAIRCAKVGVKYPAEWQEYDSALRAIVSSQSGDAGTSFPVRPAYPSGT